MGAGALWLSACASLIGLASWAMAAPELDARAWQRLAAALSDPASDLALPATERAALLATAALELGDAAKAARIADPYAQADPLAAMVAAEAHRRLALAKLADAGDYARPVASDARLLAAADLAKGLAEARARAALVLDRLDGVLGVPVDILKVPEGQSVFIVDKARARLMVFHAEAGKLVRVADEYVVTGKKGGDKRHEGDGRTPSGVYRFLGARRDPALMPRYGPIVFPIDYPNPVDRLEGKNGHGIWLHGYPKRAKRRPPQDTRGCFSVPNDTLVKLAHWIAPETTWVVVGSNLRFNEDEARKRLADSLTKAIERWRRDWESLDVEAYLRHYDARFRAGAMDLRAWARYKRRIARSKTFIRVQISKLMLLHDPHPHPFGELAVASFVQRYVSNNYRDITRKRLYLVRRSPDAPWRILAEEAEPLQAR